jgi:hypothetical protein
MRKTRLLPALFLCILAASTIRNSSGAEIEKRTLDNTGLEVITISGPIVLGDEARFRSLASVSGEALVVLNSEGGSTLAAIEIGKAIRLAGFATAVPSNLLCASACALVWLSGSPRFSESDSHVGFHASYIMKNGQASESGVGNALVGAYLTQLGLSQRTIIFVTSAPPEGIEWLDQNKARSAGIDFASLKSARGQSNLSSNEFGTSVDKYDPIAAVNKFYNALSSADGSAAAALVIPEKRGTGPFNEINIAKFFGNMREPLHLVSLTQSSPTLVLVEYRYVYSNGKICNGKSEVTTNYVFGKTLIQGIHALNNC